MPKNTYLLNKFMDQFGEIKQAYRISISKQNKIIRQFIDRVNQLNNGFMVNDAVVAELLALMPRQFRISAKEGLNARTKDVCQNNFADQMDILYHCVKYGWDSCGDYPYHHYETIIAASECMVESIETIELNMLDVSFRKPDKLAEGCEQVLDAKIIGVAKSVCEFNSSFEYEYVLSVCRMQKSLFCDALKRAWNQTFLLNGLNMVENENKEDESIALLLASKQNARAKRRAKEARLLKSVQERSDQNVENFLQDIESAQSEPEQDVAAEDSAAIDYCFENFTHIATIHSTANRMAARWQKRQMHELEEPVSRCANGDEALALVARALKVDLLNMKSINAASDPAINDRMIQNIRVRQRRLNTALKHMVKRGADQTGIVSYLQRFGDNMMFPYGTIIRVLSVRHDGAKGSGEFLTACMAAIHQELNDQMHRCIDSRLSGSLRHEVRSLIRSEVRLLESGIKQEWNQWLDEYSKRPFEQSDETPGFDDVYEDPFAGAPPIEVKAEQREASNTQNDEANILEVCQLDQLQDCLKSFKCNKSTLNPRDKETLEQMVHNKGMARLESIPADYKSTFAEFRQHFPNMCELADIIEGRFTLQSLSGVNMPAQMANNMLVLDGPPGVGKTVGIRWLAEHLGITHTVLNFAEMSNGFDISGLTRGYGTGKPGLIARELLGKQVANPVIMFDEVEKGHQNSDNMPPYKPLYSLLERESAAHFKDEFLNLEMDASRINWLATCNEFELIPEPIRDRSRKIFIAQPNEMQRISIIKYLYQDMREKNESLWGKFFVPELSDAVAYMLATVQGISVRRLVDLVDRCVIAAAGNGAAAGAMAVNEDDAAKVIRGLQGGSSGRMPIGFIH